MNICQQCQTLLVAEGISQGQKVRCAKCSHVFRLGVEEKTSADRLAWRSFWLGLASLILVFFTGIPAIYYGIRSLLRMRYIKARPGDRAAAITGMAMGGCFGLIGLFAVGLGAIIGVAILTAEKTTDRQKIEQLYSQHFQQELHSELIPISSASVLNLQFSFAFANDKDITKRNIGVHLTLYNPNIKPTNTQIMLELRKNSSLLELDLEETSSEILRWKLGDKDVDISKVTYDIRSTANDDPAKTVEQPIDGNSATEYVVKHYGFSRSKSGIIGMAVVTKQPNASFPEEKIRDLFARIRLIED